MLRLPTLCALFLAGCLLLSAQAPDPADRTETAVQRPGIDDGASLKLIRNFLTVTGGKQAHNELRNVVATGTIKEAGKIRSFEVVETQDGRRRITYTWKHLGREYSTVYGFDGVHTWKRELLPKKLPANQISGAEANHFKRQRWFIQPFVLPLRADYVFNYQGAGKVGGRPAHIVVGYGKANERSWFYFDQEKFLLTQWGGLGPVAGVRKYLDYRATRFESVAGVILPKEIDLLVEDAVFGSIRFDSIQANQPIDLTQFYLPPDTIPRLRQRPVRQ